MADASLVFKVDSSEVKAGEKSLDKLASAGDRAEKSAGRMASSYSGLNKMMDSATAASAAEDTAELDKQLQSLLTSINPTYAGLKKLDQGADTLSRAFKAGLITSAQYKSNIALLESGFAKATVETEKSIFANQRARLSMVALGREMATGNFAAMPGTLASLAASSNISAAALIGAGGAAAILVAGIGAVGYAAYKVAADLTEMDRAVILSGGFSGVTAASMRSLAEEINHTSEMTMGASLDMAVAFANTGKIGAAAFGEVMNASAAYVAASGMAADEVATHMIKMFSDPSKGAEELNSTMHFLSLAEMQRITDLQESGRVTDAQTVLAKALREELEEHPVALGGIERALQTAKKTWSEYWDTAMGKLGGRELSLQERLDSVRRGLAVIPKGHANRAIYEAEERRLMNQIGAEATEASAKAALSEANAQDQLAMRYAKGNSDIAKRVELQNKINLLMASWERQEGGTREADILAEAINKAQKELEDVGKVKAKRKRVDDSYIENIGRETEAILKNAATMVRENEGISKTAEQLTVLEVARIDEQVAAKTAEATRLTGIKGREAELFLIQEQIKGLLNLRKAREDKGMLVAAGKTTEETERAQEKAQAEMTRRALSAQQIYADVDPLYKAGLAWEKYMELVEGGYLDLETAAKHYAQSFGETTDQMTEFAKRAGENIQDAFAEFLFDPFKGGVQGMLDGFTTMLRKMAAEALASQILGSIGAWGKTGGGAGSIIGGIAAAVFGGGKAAGGSVSSGTTYLVGERGPELFTPSGSGNITPNDKLGKSVTVINNFTISQPTDRRTQEQIAAMAGASIQSAMLRGA